MFFNYLIERNEIKKDDLMEVLFSLSESQPSLLRVLFEDKRLSADQVLEIVNAQVSESKGLTQVLLDGGFISKEDLNKSLIKRNERGNKFGEIISEKSLVSPTRLEELFLEYTKESAATDVKEETVDEPSQSNQPAVNAAALESLKELGIEDDSLIAEATPEVNNTTSTNLEPVELSIFANELVNSLDDKFFKKIEKISKIIGDAVTSQSDVNTYLNTLYKDFHIVKGAACLAEAKQMEEVLNKWEEVLESLFKYEEEQIRNWFSGHSNIIPETLSLLGKMKENIQVNNSLSSGVENEYNQIITDLVA